MRRRLRIALGIAGACVLSLALLVVAVPAVSEAFPSDALVEAVGSDYVLAAAVGVVAILFVVAVVARRGLDGVDQATMPNPETVQHAAYPGVRFDRTVTERLHLLPHRPTEEEKRLRARIRRAAEREVMRRENVSQERASEMIESGEWTDDDAAATFLSNARRPWIGARLRALVSRRSWFQTGARRAADEVCRLGGVEPGTGTGGENSESAVSTASAAGTAGGER
ncbi:hypothetical protein SAMN04488063_0257 [Halopelagius inordinatus]|uniref:Uncharacterized protein n=1 Tax=Halopelagius inordinatus TaxID=553467 RepID=A0A1I2LHR5_9EURY|nr:hypothetical protein [Halopelagius inordinatus]SFF78000.1 hypothetical protein SAMN04488063_0257 [Halopelagius inordinatus]